MDFPFEPSPYIVILNQAVDLISGRISASLNENTDRRQTEILWKNEHQDWTATLALKKIFLRMVIKSSVATLPNYRRQGCPSSFLHREDEWKYRRSKGCFLIIEHKINKKQKLLKKKMLP